MTATEELGKTFEQAICLIYKTPYVGTFRYSLEKATALSARLTDLPTHFPACHHTAAGGSPYDFTTTTTDTDTTPKHLSAKTSQQRDGKVCPQRIGQPTRLKFCQYFGLPTATNADIKSFIVSSLPTLLSAYETHTFGCHILYYNRPRNLIQLIQRTHPIDWTTKTLQLSHILRGRVWNESTTVYLIDSAGEKTSIGEFQVHTHRDCIKFRWCFERLLNAFPDAFRIVTLTRCPAPAFQEPTTTTLPQAAAT